MDKNEKRNYPKPAVCKTTIVVMIAKSIPQTHGYIYTIDVTAWLFEYLQIKITRKFLALSLYMEIWKSFSYIFTDSVLVDGPYRRHVDGHQLFEAQLLTAGFGADQTSFTNS